MTEETRFIRRTALIAAAAFCVCSQTWAREITGLDVSADDATATVTMTAGEDGDSHVLYYAWSTDGADKGADISAWPHVLRTGRVADDATVATIELPAAAAVTAQYACRAFLATSAVDYDYLVEGTKGSATKNNVTFLNTGLLPVGGKWSVSVDCILGKNTTQQYLFGSNGGKLTFCAYVNGNRHWAFACNNGGGDWNMATTLEANTSDRLLVFLDSTGSTATGMVTVVSSGAQYVKTTTSAHTATANTGFCLWGRGSNGAGTTIDHCCAATIYRCVITNDGVCVRDFRPAVKDGVAGMWDAGNDKFYASAGTTAFAAVGTNTTYFVAEGDATVAQSAVWARSVPDYDTPEPYVVPMSLAFQSGGTKRGAAPLTLSGANDWGGIFTVYEGTLVADFGQGVASTDRIVLDGGTYRPVSGSFAGGLGGDPGQLSVAAGVESAGFSAYGGPLAVRLWNDAEIPLVVGSDEFPASKLVLNDFWADDVLTFENSITRSDGEALTIETRAGTAVVKGSVTNEGSFYHTGTGTLVLRGAEFSCDTLCPRQGNLVFAPPEGEESCALSFKTLNNYTNLVSNMTISNATTTHLSGGNLGFDGNTTLTIVGGSMTSSADWYPGNRSGADREGKGAVGTIVMDGANVKTTGDFVPGYYSSQNKNCYGDLIVTNGATFSMSMFNGRYGTTRQYSGKVKVTYNGGGAMRIGSNGGGTYDYHLHGGTLDVSGTGSSATFSLGFVDSTASPKGRLYVYEGGEFIARGASGLIGRYQNDRGELHVIGGSATMTRAACTLYVGYLGNGVCTVSDGGTLTVNGNVVTLPKSSMTGRTGTLSVLTNGTAKARCFFSTCTNDTATLVLDGGTLVANASASENFIYGFTNAYVGVGGAVIDTAGFDLAVAQDFDALAEQPRPLDGIESASGDDLAALCAFTKAGEGTLTLTGSNAWACATCVSNGTLAASGEFSLPETTTLQLAGGVLDLCGRTHTVSNLVGSGVVSNGALVVTGAVWPGHRGGVMEFRDATLSARKLSYAFGDDGKCGCLVMGGALDLDGVEITVDNADAKERPGVAIVHAASISGAPTSALVGSNALSVSANAVRVGLAGMWILMR